MRLFTDDVDLFFLAKLAVGLVFGAHLFRALSELTTLLPGIPAAFDGRSLCGSVAACCLLGALFQSIELWRRRVRREV